MSQRRYIHSRYSLTSQNPMSIVPALQMVHDLLFYIRVGEHIIIFSPSKLKTHLQKYIPGPGP